MMTTNRRDRLLPDLVFLYGEEEGRLAYAKLCHLLDDFQADNPNPVPLSSSGRFDEADTVLITYGDMVQTEGEVPLATLLKILEKRILDVVSTVHILPFFPYSSDDGFSIIDYRAVDPRLGTWDEIRRIGQSFKLMFDAVINHISAESAWFKNFLANIEPYTDYFIVVAPDTDLSSVFRPRTSPLLTPVEQVAGNHTVKKWVWTTFSSDQIDLNFANPDLLLEVIEILLSYVARGAQLIRLDAVAFIWKEIGTSSIHLPQTHRIIQLMRKMLDLVAPGVTLITETNVPHQENISYFGDGTNEAQMVYNFSLPPLTLQAFQTGDASKISQWIASLTYPGDQVTYFNFLASHDGIGVTPARGILDESEINQMVERVEHSGGLVSYKTNPDGSSSPYELNINYLDALAGLDSKEESTKTAARRFLAAQAIMLALRGVPGIYFHSLFGSRGWLAGVQTTGRARTINREKLKRDDLERALADPDDLRHQVFIGYRQLLAARRSSSAFHPNGEQIVLSCQKAVLALGRISPDGLTRVLCLQNVAPNEQQITVDLSLFNGSQESIWRDLLSPSHFSTTGSQLKLTLDPYQVYWLAQDLQGLV